MCVALLVAACTPEDGLVAQITGPDAVPVPTASDDGVEDTTVFGRLVDDGCPFAAPATATPTCHRLLVPSAWIDPSSPEISVQVAVFAATDPSGDHAANPVIWFEGGPGAGPIETIAQWFDETFSEINTEFDVVFFDPRGTGFSLPSLDCPELDELYLIAEGSTLGDQAEAMRQCSNRLAREGVDVRDYDSLATARDVEALRRALGADSWNLIGQSYGTRLAQTYVREFPGSVRSMVLDGAYSAADEPDDDLAGAVPALERLLDACTNDVRCNTTYPDTSGRFGDLIAEAGTDGIEVDSVDPDTGEAYTYVLDDAALADIVFQSMYSTYHAASWPRIVSNVEAGDTSLLDLLVSSLSSAGASNDDVGVFYSVQCRDEWSFVTANDTARPTAFTLNDDAAANAWSLLCANWGAGAADPVEAHPISTDVPTLILAGEFDPITPREGAIALQGELGATFVEFAQVGHGTIGALRCASTTTGAFIKNLTLPANADGVADVACAEDHLRSDLFVSEPGDSPLGEPTVLTLNGSAISVALPDWLSFEPGDGYLIRDSRLSDLAGLLVDVWNRGETADEIAQWYADEVFLDRPQTATPTIVNGHSVTSYTGSTNQGVVLDVVSDVTVSLIDVGDGVTVAITLFANPGRIDAELPTLDAVVASVSLVSP